MRKYTILFLITLLFIYAIVFGQDRQVGLYTHEKQNSFQGYTLFAPKHNTMTYLIDNYGRKVHEWTACQYEPGQSVYLLENGHLIRCCFTKNKVFGGGGDGGRIEEYDWDDNLVWEMNINTGDKNNPSDAKMMHHDVEILPNGNILAIVWEYKSTQDAINAGRRPDMLPDNALWPDCIYEIEKTALSGGNIVWEWHVWDHLVQDFDPAKENYGNVGEHPELADINFWAETNRPAHANWNHTNSIDYNAELDQIMISVRGFSEIWIIDHSTTIQEAAGHRGGRSDKGGDILYRWGNPRAYRAGTGTNQILYQGHDPQWIDEGYPGEGDIIMFNNGPELGYSSVVVWDIPQTDSTGNYHLSDGGTYGPEDACWKYQPDTPYQEWKFFSGEISGAQRLANGNTLICSGTKGFFSEVTMDHRVVWEYICPVGQDGPLRWDETPPLDNRGHGMNGVFKIHRYAPDYPGLAGKDLTPQGVIELNPSKIQDSDKGVEAPVQFSLHQNYPNPFNPQTVISFQLSTGDQTGLVVFDILGRKVKILVDEFKSAGFHEIVWDGTNDNGKQVGSGIFVYKLFSGPRIDLKKMILTR